MTSRPTRSHFSKVGGTSAPKGRRPRLFYIDWLRVFLTINVVLLHAMVTYIDGDMPGMWAGQVQDGLQDDTLLNVFDFFAKIGLAYRMMMFFAIAGFFSRQSFCSRGATRFLLDRTLRLLVPTLVYSFIIPPMLAYVSDTSSKGLMYNRVTVPLDFEDASGSDYDGEAGRRLLQTTVTQLQPNLTATEDKLPAASTGVPSSAVQQDIGSPGEDLDEADNPDYDAEGNEAGHDQNELTESTANETISQTDDGGSELTGTAMNGTNSDLSHTEDGAAEEAAEDDQLSAPPAPSLWDEYVYYYTEPLVFNVAAGPQWFVYHLWWFTLAYVAVMELSKLVVIQTAWSKSASCCRRPRAGGNNLTQLELEQAESFKLPPAGSNKDTESLQIIADAPPSSSPGTPSGSQPGSAHGSHANLPTLPGGQAAPPGTAIDPNATVVTFYRAAAPDEQAAAGLVCAEPLTCNANVLGSAPLQLASADSNSAAKASSQEFPVHSFLLWGGLLIFSLSVLQFCARLAMWTNPDMLPDLYSQFYLYAINIEPAYFPQYVAAFVGGILAHKYDGFTRIPTKVGLWGLGAACLSYPAVWAAFMVADGLVDSSYWGRFPMYGPYVVFVLGHSFFEMCWGTVFGVGLLVFFREAVNIKPGRVGAIIVGATYAVYIIHPIFVTLWGRALEGFEFPTFWINAIFVAYLTAISAWLVGAVLKLIPGCSRIL